MNYYFDSSALVKMFSSENHSVEFQNFFLTQSKAQSKLFSSALSKVEIFRSLQRQEKDVSLVDEFLKSLSLLRLSDSVISLAQIVAPGLRLLDAIHLATALQLRPLDLTFVTYYKPLAKAAKEAGLPCISPGL
ncbi:MAG: ribonuclease VapC [Actinomycetota bacterium]